MAQILFDCTYDASGSSGTDPPDRVCDGGGEAGLRHRGAQVTHSCSSSRVKGIQSRHQSELFSEVCVFKSREDQKLVLDGHSLEKNRRAEPHCDTKPPEPGLGFLVRDALAMIQSKTQISVCKDFIC